jgi:hypothetical protein
MKMTSFFRFSVSWSTGRMKLTGGKPKYSEKKRVPMPLCPPQNPHGLTLDFFFFPFFPLIHFVLLNPSVLHVTYVPYYCPYTTNNTNIHALGGIPTHNPSKRTAADPRLRPRGHYRNRASAVRSRRLTA